MQQLCVVKMRVHHSNEAFEPDSPVSSAAAADGSGGVTLKSVVSVGDKGGGGGDWRARQDLSGRLEAADKARVEEASSSSGVRSMKNLLYVIVSL